MGDSGPVWRCLDCLYESKIKTNVLEHVESKHVLSLGVQCPVCNAVCPNRKSLRNHCYRHHKQWK